MLTDIIDQWGNWAINGPVLSKLSRSLLSLFDFSNFSRTRYWKILTIPLMEIDIATHGISRMYIFNFN